MTAIFDTICDDAGEVPSFLGTFASLFTLNLSHNALNKALTTFVAPPSLVSIDLSYNAIPGGFPTGINTAINVGELDLSHNKLTGPLPTGSYGTIRKLHVSYNSLSGSIPPSLGDTASNLFDLDLSHNKLSGAIPASLAKQQYLQFLDLSHNYLIGQIPSAFSTLQYLITVHLGANKLSGPVPSGAFWSSLPVSAYRPGNSGLCGKPLPPCK